MPKATVFYHYFPPDDVVSAIHFGELCAELSALGWEVTAYPSNRGCRNEQRQYSLRERWRGVVLKRVWRPPFKQSSTLGRLLNAAWMITSWSLLATNRKISPDVLIVGTDPILSVTVAIVWKLLKPRTKVVHWCFDLYPEAAIADGALSPDSLIARLLRAILKKSYAKCDLIVDIGSCMGGLIRKYGSTAQTATLVPWALEEPENVVPAFNNERQAIYGDTSLTLMYSGSFGRAHSFEDILALVRQMQSDDITVAFSVRGNREKELRQAVDSADNNISFVPFAPAEKLLERLGAADIHIVTLREEWTGTVVPSKFFGALAAGRPVMFCGSPESSLAKWIREYKVGWVLTKNNLTQIEEEFRSLIQDRSALEALFRHCYMVYQEHFSKSVITVRWNKCLRMLLSENQT